MRLPSVDPLNPNYEREQREMWDNLRALRRTSFSIADIQEGGASYEESAELVWADTAFTVASTATTTYALPSAVYGINELSVNGLTWHDNYTWDPDTGIITIASASTLLAVGDVINVSYVTTGILISGA
jgi:hypothetical protein